MQDYEKLVQIGAPTSERLRSSLAYSKAESEVGTYPWRLFLEHRCVMLVRLRFHGRCSAHTIRSA